MPITTKEGNKQQKGIRIVVYVFVYNYYNENSFFSFFFVKKISAKSSRLENRKCLHKNKRIIQKTHEMF